ncbi:MAG: deoxyhypusine synthase family protein, partial [Planctomycetota bacterium]|nr:deoxyhypusine synthase family protein [Planctomycetota bacterium]
MDVRTFIDLHFSHFNSRELRRSAQAYETHIKAGGKMMVSLAGAMSTARVGRILSRAIRADLVHAVSCTGANLEEDAFCLVAGNEYEEITNWRALQAEDELALYQRGMNRVTDTCIPETVMRHLEGHLLNRWRHACAEGRSELPSAYLLEAINHPDVVQHHQAPEDSWLLAAHEKNIPIFTPGWEDSTLGNAFAAMVYKDKLPHHNCVITGTEQMILLMDWYRAQCQPSPTAPSVGFFQIGGGIAGDFAICAVPALIQ